ncbi:outer membrane beta-barrel protein [Ancylobacter sp. A5.8]|uniref:outer membrane protein n=1 Tax=Ancylobacter gelatini TaxID=2919920 RepID=UPI001F4E7350|nr:outer membrane beta-barrel protein [Ancylobacter gelatini]MCJ8142058.1 outer membrane beta-barrel protein [Ancylobacter gelatini]
MKLGVKLAVLAVAGLMAPAAHAADIPAVIPVTSSTPAVDWTGFYLGGVAGGVVSSLDHNSIAGAVGLVGQSYGCVGGLCDGKRESYAVGATFGYNQAYADGGVLGIEADVAYSGLDEGLDFAGIVPLSANQRLDATGMARVDTPFLGTLRLRAGYAVGRFLPFVTAGVAVTYSTVELQSLGIVETQTSPGNWTATGAAPVSVRGSGWTAGWTAGGGLEYAISERWSAKTEYLYVDLITSTLGDETPKHQMLRAGLNYRY